MKNALEILFENDAVVAVNKPADILSVAGRNTDKQSVESLLVDKELFKVHRIDAETSGVLLFAKNKEAQVLLSKQFEERQTQKIYHALVCGKMRKDSGTIDVPLKVNAQGNYVKMDAQGKEALTQYECIESFAKYSFVQVQIFTGRMHQIRVHLAGIGHPIVADGKYGNGKALKLSDIKRNYKNTDKEEAVYMGSLALHASSLSFFLPKTDHVITVTAALPKTFELSLKMLRKYGNT